MSDTFYNLNGSFINYGIFFELNFFFLLLGETLMPSSEYLLKFRKKNTGRKGLKAFVPTERWRYASSLKYQNKQLQSTRPLALSDDENQYS